MTRSSLQSQPCFINWRLSNAHRPQASRVCIVQNNFFFYYFILANEQNGISVLVGSRSRLPLMRACERGVTALPE